ncbi:MAG: glycosyltransferase family 117 protein [Anaerolineae bacterium]
MRYSSGPSVARDSNPSPSVLASWDKLIAGILAGGSAALYIRTCAPSLLFGDSGEFQFVPYILGIAHPTGYPLYVMLGWLWSHLLPLGNVAYRMNVFSSLWAALTVGAIFLLAREFMARTIGERDFAVTRVAAGIASASFAVTQTFWGQAVIAEVYTLNAFFVALVLLLFLHWTQAPLRRSRIIALASTFGLALTHHRTILALLPGMFVCFLLLRPSGDQGVSVALSRARVLWREGMIGITCLLAPLLLYLYLPLRAPYVPYTTISLSQEQQLVLYENTGQGLLDHITGAVFVENLRLGLDLWGTAPSWTMHLAMVVELLRRQFGLVGICLAFVGLARMVWTRQWPWLSLTALGYVTGVLFNLLYAIGDVEVLYIPSYLVVTLWIGIGLVTLAEMVARVSTRWTGYGVLLLSVALPGWLLVQHLPQVDRSSDVAAETMWRPILERPIPFDTVLVSNDRDEMMPLWYYQYVEGQRRDLLGLFPRIVAEPAYKDIGGVLDQASASGRPVFLIKPMPGLEVKVQLEHEEGLASLVRVVGPAAARPPMHRVDASLGGRVRLVGYNVSPAAVRAGDTLMLQLYWEPLQPLPHNYTTYVHVVDNTGDLVAQSDHLPGGVYYPTSLWKQGEQLLDTHTITLRSTNWSGMYQLWAGMYLYPTMQSLGAAVWIGSVAVAN